MQRCNWSWLFAFYRIFRRWYPYPIFIRRPVQGHEKLFKSIWFYFITTCTRTHNSSRFIFIRFIKIFKKNGKFIIEVPNFESPWRYIFKKHYSQLGLPFHTFHFSPKSIANAIPNFRILSITKASIPILAKSFLKIFNVKISELGILTTCFYPLQGIFDIFF